jgi:hypothetical protein
VVSAAITKLLLGSAMPTSSVSAEVASPARWLLRSQTGPFPSGPSGACERARAPPVRSDLREQRPFARCSQGGDRDNSDCLCRQRPGQALATSPASPAGGLRRRGAGKRPSWLPRQSWRRVDLNIGGTEANQLRDFITQDRDDVGEEVLEACIGGLGTFRPPEIHEQAGAGSNSSSV